MENNKKFFFIYIPITILLTIVIIILSVLGSKTRIGYIELSDKTFYNSQNHLSKFDYNFNIMYYDKIFRNSDIYDVYIDTNSLPEYISKIKFSKEGSRFGLITSKKIIYGLKINNIKYYLKIKRNLIYITVILLLFPLIYFFVSKNNSFNIRKLLSENKIYLYIILAFAIFIRIFWAAHQNGMYWDEYHSLMFSNYGVIDNRYNIPNYFNKLGYDVLKDITINDASIKDCINDIIRLYKNTNDPFISNLYYSLLRLSFIGREAVDIKNIIITGTILNCIFFIISFIFLYKILKLIFEDKLEYILFSLLIMSLSPISISFSMFLRSYQMQETFFIVITYIVIYTIYNKKYSLKNIIITSIIAAIGYLTLYSSMLFVLILSAMLFITYLLNINKSIKIGLLEINSYKIIIYYAVSFISALFISRILYAGFFYSLFNANNRASTSLQYSGVLGYIDKLSFNGLLSVLFFILVLYITISLIEHKKIHIDLEKEKIKIIIFIILLGMIYAILANISAPFKLERYSAPSYILILFLYTLIFLIIDNKNMKYSLFILLSIAYIYNVTNSYRFSYFENFNKDDFVLKENIDVYAYDAFFDYYEYTYEHLNTNSHYTYMSNINDLNKITNSSEFYLLMNEEKEYIFTNEIFSNYNITYIAPTYRIYVFKLQEIK